MPTFNNVSSTSATPNPGFDYSPFEAAMHDATASLATAVMTVATADPTSQALSSGFAHFGYANGARLDATILSQSLTSVSFSHAQIGAGDGAVLNLSGTAQVTMKGGVMSAKPATLTSLAMGNEDALQLLDGSMKLDILNGTLSGKASALTLAFSDDDPNTTAHEWNYVKLLGKAAVAGNVAQGLQSFSGKLSGVEWGTLETTDSGTVTVHTSGAVSGLKMDAGTIMSGLHTSDFAALKAGLYGGNDVINGTEGNDLLEAGAGNDKVYGLGGNDHIDGGVGNDQLFGGAGDDTIIGGAGNDKIVAGDGANIVNAGGGNDSIVCGSGHDWINGGAGADKLVGGAGADVFMFDNLAAGGKDSIADFNAAEDIFAFDTSVFTSLAGGITSDNLVIGKAALDANDFLIFDATGGKLYYDADGNGTGAAIQIADVKGALGGISALNFADAHLLLV